MMRDFSDAGAEHELEKENLPPTHACETKRRDATPSTAAGTPLSDKSSDLAAELLSPARRLELEPPPRRIPTWEASGVVLPIFMGYASLFALQHKVKSAYGIADDMSPLSRAFTASTSLLYLGNLTFRLGHTLFARWLSPRGRVFLSLGCMMTAMLILGVMVFCVGSRWIGWVPLAYGCGGVAVGTFEANLLATLSPLEGAKLYAVTAIPIGITVVTVGAFLLLSLGVHVAFFYFFVSFACVCGMLLMRHRIPDTTMELKGHRSLVANVRSWREWFPSIASLPIAFSIDMFCVSTFSPGVLLFVYDDPHTPVPLFGSEVTPDVFFALYNTATFFGGFLGRSGGYRIPRMHPLWFTPLSLVAVALIFTKRPELQLMAGFCCLLADGLVYSQTCRNIDARVPHEYAVMAMSVWLFVGDIGSVTGSNLILQVRQMLV
jgi:hypothetical protein